MTELRRQQPLALILLGAALVAAAWPLTAMKLSPMLLPVLLVGGLAVSIAIARPALGIAIALALAPLIDSTIGFGGATGQLAQPLQIILPGLIVSVAFVTALSRGAHAENIPMLLSLTPLVFLGLALASSMQAIQPSQSINSIVILLTAILVFYSVLRLGAAEEDRITILAGALAGLALAGAQGLLQKLLGLAGPYGVTVGGHDVLRVQGSFDHPNGYSVYLIALIPLAIAVAMTKTAPLWLRRLAASGAVLGVMGVAFSYSRGAIIGLVVGALAWVFLLRPGRVTLLAVGLGIVALLAAPASLKARFDPTTARDDAGLREGLWQAAYDIGSREPILGVGPNNFSVAYERLVNRRGDAAERPLLDQGSGFVLPSSAHNMYLNTLAEQGLLGLFGLALLGLASIPMLYAGRLVRDPLGRAICGGVGAGAAAWAVRGMFDAGLYGDVIIPGAALIALAAIIVGADRADRARRA